MSRRLDLALFLLLLLRQSLPATSGVLDTVQSKIIVDAKANFFSYLPQSGEIDADDKERGANIKMYDDICRPLMNKSSFEDFATLTTRLRQDPSFARKIKESTEAVTKKEDPRSDRVREQKQQSPGEASEMEDQVARERQSLLPLAPSIEDFDLRFVEDVVAALGISWGTRDGSIKTDLDFRQQCLRYVRERGYHLNSPYSREEAEFPLAYILAVHKSIAQVESLIRAIWHRQNTYCVHVDLNAPREFRNQVRALVHCLNLAASESVVENGTKSQNQLRRAAADVGQGGTVANKPKSAAASTKDNIFMVSDPVAVYYTSFTRLEADLRCMTDLDRFQYKYVINLCGQDYPLKSNLQIVRDMASLHGKAETFSVDINRANKLWRIKETWDFRPATKERIAIERACDHTEPCKSHKRRARELDSDWRAWLKMALGDPDMKEGVLVQESSSRVDANDYVFNTHIFHDEAAGQRGSAENWYGSPLGANTGVFSGSAYYALPKPMVVYVQNAPLIKDFLDWTRLTWSPDEIFWGTVARHYPDVPGAVSPHRDYDLTEMRSRTRLIIWQDKGMTVGQFARNYDPVQSQSKYWLMKWLVNVVIKNLFGYSDDEMAVIQGRGFFATWVKAQDWNFDPFREERVNVVANPPCQGEYIRKSCVYGAFDLPWFGENPHWYANKFDYKVDPVPIHCLDLALRERVRQQMLLTEQ